MEENKVPYALEWDSPIENDGPEFVVLPEGDYDFTVIEFERARHAGSANLPACPKAIIHIKIEGAEGTTTLKHNLFLHSTTEGFLCAFFTAIGQRKHGEKATMKWNQVVGSKGRCKLGVKTYEGKQYNEIKKFYDPAESKGFQQGKF